MGKKTYRALAALLTLVLVISVGYLAFKQIDYRKGAQDYSHAQEVAGAPDLTNVPAEMPWPEGPAEPGETDPPEPSGPVDDAAAALAAVDLEALRAVNTDVIGWICIPGTDLSYPLLQGWDNSYYLNNTWQRQRSAVGAIFLDYRSSLADSYALIYGHRMNNTTMFGTLKYYDSEAFWREHPSVYLVHGSDVKRYDIFAAFEAGVHSDIYRLNLPEADREAFLTWCLEQSVIDTGLVPNAADRVVCLSTCTASGGAATRWVVLGVLSQAKAPVGQ